MSTTRTIILAEIESRLRATGRPVERNPAMARELSDAGKIFMADGDPGEPEETISVRSYTYTHNIPIEIVIPGDTPSDRDGAIQQVLGQIKGQFPDSDVDLGGIADQVEIIAPEVKSIQDEGGPEILVATFAIRVIYTTEHSLAV